MTDENAPGENAPSERPAEGAVGVEEPEPPREPRLVAAWRKFDAHVSGAQARFGERAAQARAGVAHAKVQAAQAKARVDEQIEKLPIPREEQFKGGAHGERVTARIGALLGLAFLICFVTGLLSHLIQHPPGWFFWPSRPVWLYRVTQGAHVISGIAAIPLLLAKLWSVFPKLFERPLVKSLPHALERLSILVLSGSAFFELSSGLLNVAQNYPWNFYFPEVHYAVAWVAIGSVVVHVAVKLPIVRRALTREVKPALVAAPEDLPHERPQPVAGFSRRGFLRTTWIATGVAVLSTAGATVPWLKDVSGLSWKTDKGLQKLPVNRTAVAARVTRTAVDPAWRLSVVTRGGTKQLTLADLRALPQVSTDLPIACVEGWSQMASWRGISFPTLLRAVGAEPGAEVRVSSLDKTGLYGASTLPGEHTADELTLLALELNGEVLDVDHGYPCRVIAPSRPGVLQTKWVEKLEVL
ncbi:molybdopterin-dependent oxidoreductase [Amycolatopsis rhabdoformis]|uniref:Molybdopterin-dependent oxidoreductase n=1 Tax=Amycolatopsis rhabdoformis TaxID=1448059 RepID=A0ABZ1I0N3_9PSEU|nr:molybdopterin-dependent oxidoreductase [Amycolatopsis rhabdoformis]WSE27347.1 molybdopterin-dependent oxidoreductase [Amycolatopsis rhabdoformis]